MILDWLRARGREIRILRVPVTLLVLLLILLGLPQLVDVVRAWDAGRALVAIVLTGALALFVWWYSDRTVVAAQPPPASRQRLRKVVATLVVVAGVAQFVVHAFVVEVGTGLVFPALVVVALALIGWRMGAAATPPAGPGVSPVAAASLPRLLGAAVFVIVGVAAVRASVAEVVYAATDRWVLVLVLGPVVILWAGLRVLQGVAASPGWVDLGVAAAALGGGVILVVAGNPLLPPSVVLVLGVVLVFASLPFYFGLPPAPPSGALQSLVAAPIAVNDWVAARLGVPPQATALVAGSLVLTSLVAWLAVDAPGAAPRLGATGVILLLVLAVALVLGLAARFADDTDPPRFLAAVGFRRTPMLTLLLVWAIVGISFSPIEAHDVAVEPGRTAVDFACPEGVKSTAPVDAAAVFARWKCVNQERLAGSGAVPLVLVSASGGGIRAAVWTAYVLDCMLEVEATDCASGGERRADFARSDRVIAMSGISGGALGFVAYSAHLVNKQAGEEAPGDWVATRLGGDYVAPALAQVGFVDLPRSFLWFDGEVRDAADVLAEAWERSWRDDEDRSGALETGLRELWAEHRRVPVLIANGTTVGEACRFIGSVLGGDLDPRRGGAGVEDCVSPLPVAGGPGVGKAQLAPGAMFPGSVDLVDVLCTRKEDVRLSTAALLSARFPAVSPAGRFDLARCGSGRKGAVRMVDGGYRENSGALTALELWRALEPIVAAHNEDGTSCIVPFMVQIDTGYEAPPGPPAAGRAAELAMVVKAYLGVRGSVTAAARNGAALAFDLPAVPGRPGSTVMAGDRPVETLYARFAPRAHPGVQAPLGWTLSEEAIEDLRRQLTAVKSNVDQFEVVERWLGEDLRCIG